MTYLGKGKGHLVSFFITKEERDADPVPCVGEGLFTVEGIIPDWLVLN